MTSPLQQKLKVTGPVVDHRQPAGRRRRRLSLGRRDLDHRACRSGRRDHDAGGDRTADGRAGRQAQGGRRLCRAGAGIAGTGRAAGQSARVDPLQRPDRRISGRSAEDRCMYRLRRLRPHACRRARPRIPRPGRAPSLGRIDGRRVQAVAAHERRLSAAARLYAADRHSLWHALLRAVAHAGARGAAL